MRFFRDGAEAEFFVNRFSVTRRIHCYRSLIQVEKITHKRSAETLPLFVGADEKGADMTAVLFGDERALQPLSFVYAEKIAARRQSFVKEKFTEVCYAFFRIIGCNEAGKAFKDQRSHFVVFRFFDRACLDKKELFSQKVAEGDRRKDGKEQGGGNEGGICSQRQRGKITTEHAADKCKDDGEIFERGASRGLFFLYRRAEELFGRRAQVSRAERRRKGQSFRFAEVVELYGGGKGDEHRYRLVGNGCGEQARGNECCELRQERDPVRAESVFFAAEEEEQSA